MPTSELPSGTEQPIDDDEFRPHDEQIITRDTDAGGHDEAARRADDWWRHRQLEILLRIDENLRRLRQIAESRGDAPSTFTHPE